VEIFENKKFNNVREVSFLGIPLYKDEMLRGERIQHILWNFVYTKKIKSDDCERKIFKVLNFNIFERVYKEEIYNYYFLGKLLKCRHKIAPFYKKYLKNLNFEYDDVYIFNSNSGEIYLFFAYLYKTVLRKNKTAQPLFIVTQPIHDDIIKMYCPDAKYLILKNFNFPFQSKLFEYCGHRFYLIFPCEYFEKMELKIKNGEKVHYLSCMLKEFDMDINECERPAPVLISTQNLISKTDKIQLNLDNFIILAPEAQTCTELPLIFWRNLSRKIQEKGFDIFLNITNPQNDIPDCKSCYLDYTELYSLASRAKAVISLRSGLSEFILPTNVPNISIYTKFRNRKPDAEFSVDKGIAGFSMTKIPFVNKDNIVEINADNFSALNELEEVTIKSFEKFVNKEEVLI